MLNPRVGSIVLISSPLNFFKIVVLPALSSPLSQFKLLRKKLKSVPCVNSENGKSKYFERIQHQNPHLLFLLFHFLENC